MSNERNGRIHIGTSGWSYSWENFYPEDLAKRRRLTYYSQHFTTAEVNYSFYRLPEVKTYGKWLNETEEDFCFALKLSRFITHVKRLKGIKQPLKQFLSRSKALEHKRGPILVQLPPSFSLDTKRFESFLQTARACAEELEMEDLRFACEPRHKSWFEESEERSYFIQLMRDYHCAFVFAQSEPYPYPQDEPLTSDIVYVRFHGPEKLFASKYSEEAMKKWADKISGWNQKGMTVYAYFNNDMHGYAVDNAQSLQKYLGLE